MKCSLPRLLPVVLLAALSLAACGDDDSSGASGGDDGTTITVLAAASLTETFTTLAEQFEADHDGVEVKLESVGGVDAARRVAEG